MTAPTSQKSDVRPISFMLVGGGTAPDSFSADSSVNLVIRPEELVRTEPSRMSVQQTLGGAWVDNFGPGIAQINISGHTGWRRRDGIDTTDGEGRFKNLKDKVFDQWHARRKEAIRAGTDPDDVQLVFADSLDSFAVVVAPMSFTLRRSKSRPLLLQYQISLLVLDQNIDQAAYLMGAGGDMTNKTQQLLGLDSLTASINEITGYINGIENFIDKTLVAPVKAFMDQTTRLYGAVRGAVQAIDNVAGSLISIAQTTAQAGVNLFRTLAAVANIPSQIKARLMEIGGAYSNVFCVLRNALRQQIYYEDYSAMFGSSNCSSTSGGRPISVLSGKNPFYSVVPTNPPLPVKLTSSAQSNLNTLASNDPVLAPMSTPMLQSTMRSITSGMAVAA